MIISIKIILILCLVLIVKQDIKERAVWWFLFPAFLITAGYLNFINQPEGVFVSSSLLNLLIFSLILGISFLYTHFKMKVNFFKDAFGIGDLLFFIGMSFAFPTLSFIVILVFSLIFSLIIHLLLKNGHHQTVPLAGYAALFTVLIYISHWTGIHNNLYYL